MASAHECCTTADIDTLLKHHGLSTKDGRCCTGRLMEEGSNMHIELFNALLQLLEDWTSADKYINNLRQVAGWTPTPARKQLYEQCFQGEASTTDDRPPLMDQMSVEDYDIILREKMRSRHQSGEPPRKQSRLDCTLQNNANLGFVLPYATEHSVKSQPEDLSLRDTSDVETTHKLGERKQLVDTYFSHESDTPASADSVLNQGTGEYHKVLIRKQMKFGFQPDERVLQQSGLDWNRQHDPNLRLVLEHVKKHAMKSPPAAVSLETTTNPGELIENGYSNIISCLQRGVHKEKEMERQADDEEQEREEEAMRRWEGPEGKGKEGFKGSDVLRYMAHKLSDIVKQYIDIVNAILKVEPSAIHEQAAKGCQNSGGGDICRMLLESAVSNGNCELVRVLLEAPCCRQSTVDINQRYITTGDTLLHVAAGLGTPENIFDSIPKTCELKDKLESCFEDKIMFWKFVKKYVIEKQQAVAANYTEIVQLLIKHGADVNSTNELGDTPLHKAASSEWYFCHVFPDLVDHIRVSASENCKCYRTSCAWYGLDENYLDEYCRNSEYVDNTVRILITNHAVVNAKTLAGNTPLHVAVMASAKRIQLSRDLVEVTDSVTENNRKISNKLDKTNDFRRKRLARYKDQVITVSFLVRSDLFCMARALLTHGADWCMSNNEGDTAFLLAVRSGQIGLVEELIRRGTDVNDSRISWPEYFVVISLVAFDSVFLEDTTLNIGEKKRSNIASDVKSVVRMLSSHGVSINRTTAANQTALHLATERCSSTAVDMLPQLGADVNAVDNCGRTPLHIAAEHNYNSCVNVIMRKYNVKPTEQREQQHWLQRLKKSYPLHNADKPDISKLDNNGHNPLTVAILNNSYETVLIMLENVSSYGSESVVQTSYIAGRMREFSNVFEVQYGEPVLHFAAAANLLPLMKLLLDAGVNVNSVNTNHQTALHIAAAVDILKFMRDDLTVAAEASEAFHFLMDNEADVSIKDRTGQTALGLAFRCMTYWDLAAALKRCLTDVCHAEIVTNLKRGRAGFTTNKSTFEIERLFQVDELVHLRGSNGSIVWHLTLDPLSSDQLKFLIENGADINAQNSDGETILHFVMKHRDTMHHRETKYEKEMEYVMRLVTDHGADINMEDASGYTPLQYGPRRVTSEWSSDAVVIEDKHGNCLVKVGDEVKVEVVCPFAHINDGISGNERPMIASILSSDQVTDALMQKDDLERNCLHKAFIYHLIESGRIVTTDYRVIVANRPPDKADIDGALKRIPKSVLQKLAAEKDYMGRIPAHYAAMKGYGSSVLDLGIVGADSDKARDKFNLTPAKYVSVENESGSCDVKYNPIRNLRSRVLFQSNVISIDRSHKRNCNGNGHRYEPDTAIEQCFNKPETFPNYLRSVLPNVTAADLVWTVWKGLNYPERLEEFSAVNNAVTDFMNRLVEAIGREDPRLKGRLWSVGSMLEGTKISTAHEFDFNIELVDFGATCEVQAPANPNYPGFYVLRRQQPGPLDGYDEFFDDRDQLMSRKLSNRFHRSMINVLSGPEFWKDENYLELVDLSRKPNFCNKVTLCFRKSPIDDIKFRYLFQKISVDVVPVIRIADWMPSEIVLTDEISSSFTEGCFFILNEPFKMYRIPYSSTQYVRISFGQAESRLIRDRCSDVVRAAYMVAKYITIEDKRLSSYVLKTALLSSCPFTVTDSSTNPQNQTADSFTPDQLQRHVEALFRKLYEFSIQDYVPLFFMPSFRIPVWTDEDFIGHAHADLRCIYWFHRYKKIPLFFESLVMDYLFLWHVSGGKPDVENMFPILTHSQCSQPVSYFRNPDLSATCS